MKPSTIKQLQTLGLDPSKYTTEAPDSLVGHTVVVPNGKDSLFIVTGGFGASKTAQGTCVFAKSIARNVEIRMDRSDIIAMAL